jgi:hypothetical protein
MRRLILLVAALLVALLAAWSLDLRPGSSLQSPAHPAARDEASEIARLRQEVRSMQADSAELRRRLAPSSPPLGARVGAEAAAVGDHSAPAGEQPSFENYVTELDRQFATEAVDPAWKVREELARRVAEILPGSSRLRSLECRSTMCRVETAHADDRSYREFSAQFTLPADGVPVWNGPGIFKITHAPEREGDELDAVALLARESFPPSVSK